MQRDAWKAEKEYQQEMEARGEKTEGGVGLVGYGSQPLYLLLSFIGR